MEVLISLCIATITQLLAFMIIHIAVFRFFTIRYPALVMGRLVVACTLLFFLATFFALGFYLKMDPPISMAIALGAAGWVSFLLSVYCILGPTMADRSLSVFVLIKLMRSSQQTMTKDRLMRELGLERAMQQRYDEHTHVGAIRQDGDSLVLTPKGKRIGQLFLFMARLLKLKENF